MTNGQSPMLIEPSLYYVEIMFKNGRKSICQARSGATPDWFCQPRKKEIEDAFKAGWSMLPFKFHKASVDDEAKDKLVDDEEEFPYIKFCSDCAFDLRVWARMDPRIQDSNQDLNHPTKKVAERKFFKNVLQKAQDCLWSSLSGLSSERDIIARVDAAVNKKQQNYQGGSTYYGQMEGGKLHGYGTYTRTNGQKYVGEFKNGQKHGQGTYTRADGTIFHSGEWVNHDPKK